MIERATRSNNNNHPNYNEQLSNIEMTSPTAEWEKVGDKYYRKTQLYTAVFDQDLELENYVVTGCSYGGAIGALRYSFSISEADCSCWSHSTVYSLYMVLESGRRRVLQPIF